MKQTVATVAGVLVLVLLLTMTISGEVSAQVITKEQTERCEFVSKMAERMMVVRQHGDTLVYLLGLIETEAVKQDVSAKERSLFTGIAIEAYNENRFMSEGFKKRAITDFASKHEVACINEFWEGQ